MPQAARGEPAPDAGALADRKHAGGGTVSVCLPARNEEATVGAIVESVRRHLVEGVGLVDEIVVIDDGSTDKTAALAAAAGARVVRECDVLPEYGTGSGKGNAMWKSLAVCEGDLICFLDADVRNFDPSWVTGLVAPLLHDSGIAMVKAHYERPLHDEPTGGGRVTELVARPLLSLLFPKLAHIVQPLSGEYAGRKDAFASVPFVQGWGVEFGLLVDITERYGVDALIQADLGVREHRNRPLDELAPQALAVLAIALRRANLLALDDATVALIRPGYDDFAVEVRERPPLAGFVDPRP